MNLEIKLIHTKPVELKIQNINYEKKDIIII
jgi:hypothetical protein